MALCLPFFRINVKLCEPLLGFAIWPNPKTGQNSPPALTNLRFFSTKHPLSASDLFVLVFIRFLLNGSYAINVGIRLLVPTHNFTQMLHSKHMAGLVSQHDKLCPVSTNVASLISMIFAPNLTKHENARYDVCVWCLRNI